MERLLVMTIIGADRPGLVECVADLVARHGGNWLESRMAHLGGQFAGILRVSVPKENHEPLVSSLESLKSRGLTVTIQPDDPGTEQPTPGVTTLEIVGDDRPGIVREISRALAARAVNVEEFESGRSSAAMTGEALFRARVRIRIPPSCDTAALRRELERIAADLIVDISFEQGIAEMHAR